MKSNGTVVAVVLFVALAAFFAYQWWFNPARDVQRRLNDIATVLSVPAGEPATGRMARAARLRTYLAEDAHVRVDGARSITRDAIVSAVAAAGAPPEAWNVQFVDVQIRVDHSTNAAAEVYMTIEVNRRDGRSGQPTVDARDATVTMKKLSGEWVVCTAETQATVRR